MHLKKRSPCTDRRLISGDEKERKEEKNNNYKKRKTARKDHCELLLAAATGCVMALSFIFINNLSTGYQQQNVDNLKTIKAEENVDKARVKYESDQQKQEERFQKS